MGQHSPQPGRRDFSDLPKYLVKLAPIQVLLVVAGVALIGTGLWANTLFNRSVERLSDAGSCVDAEVIDVVWDARILPTKLKIKYEHREQVQETIAWSHAIDRLDSTDDSQAWHAGDRLRICLDTRRDGSFASPSGATFSSDLALKAELLNGAGIGILLIAASFSMSVVAWRNDGTTT